METDYDKKIKELTTIISSVKNHTGDNVAMYVLGKYSYWKDWSKKEPQDEKKTMPDGTEYLFDHYEGKTAVYRLNKSPQKIKDDYIKYYQKQLDEVEAEGREAYNEQFRKARMAVEEDKFKEKQQKDFEQWFFETLTGKEHGTTTTAIKVVGEDLEKYLNENGIKAYFRIADTTNTGYLKIPEKNTTIRIGDHMGYGQYGHQKEGREFNIDFDFGKSQETFKGIRIEGYEFIQIEKFKSTQREILNKIREKVNEELFGERLENGGTIKANHSQLGSAKELSISPIVREHDMIAECGDCGDKFSYQNAKNYILWECPECKSIKRIS